MHLVIINTSPRVKEKSNTTTIIKAFLRGYEKEGNTSEVYYLSDRKQWDSARKAFDVNENILFAVPLYVENVPGIMMEFLQSLTPKKNSVTKLSFILQGGFDEACQRRCGEHYLEKLPGYLGCEFAGILSRGSMFAVNFAGEEAGQKMVAPFEEMGELFRVHGDFLFDKAKKFTGKEYSSKFEMLVYRVVFCHISRFITNRLAKSLGCTEPLDARPYES